MKFIYIFLLLPQLSWSLEVMDDYYANDLLDAVGQAKASPHHYDYSNNYRYKRTTAQSINLNRLNHNELDETMLESGGQLDPNTVSIELSDNSTDIASQELNTNLPRTKNVTTTNPDIPLSSSYLSSYGEFKSTGVQSNTTLISTPRP